MSGYGISDLIGKEVKINRGGPDMIEGMLMDSKSDYMVISCKDGLVYVKDSHVKSVTDTGRSGSWGGSYEKPVSASSFDDVLKSLILNRVRINHGGPEKVEGMLYDANASRLILTTKDEEIIRVPMYHVKSVCALSRGKGKNKDSGKDSGKDKGKDGGKSDSGKSSGSKSQGGGKSQGSGKSQGGKSQGGKSQGGKSGYKR